MAIGFHSKEGLTDDSILSLRGSGNRVSSFFMLLDSMGGGWRFGSRVFFHLGIGRYMDMSRHMVACFAICIVLYHAICDYRRKGGIDWRGAKQMILVTGGAGYIGCVLVEKLLDRGERVRVYDKGYFGFAGLPSGFVEVVQGDLRQFDPAVLKGVDSVIHLAGLSNDPTANFNPQANHEMNTVATERLAKACKSAGIHRFTFASSCSIYDMGMEADDTPKTEESAVEPRAAYATSNYAAERILLDMADESFCPVILRQGTVYGFSPRMRYDLVVNTMLKDAFSRGRMTVHCGGEMWRPLVDVSDVARAHIKCIEADPSLVGGEIFNISFRNFRILELAHFVKAALGDRGCGVSIDVSYTDIASRSYRVDASKIERVLDFHPRVDVADSVRNMIEKIHRGSITEVDGYSAKFTDWNNPLFYNIQWMTLLDSMEKKLQQLGSVF